MAALIRRDDGGFFGEDYEERHLCGGSLIAPWYPDSRNCYCESAGAAPDKQRKLEQMMNVKKQTRERACSVGLYVM